MKMKTWKKAMLILLMLALSLIFVSPILLLLNSSFKELKEIYAYERILGQEKLLVVHPSGTFRLCTGGSGSCGKGFLLFLYRLERNR